jgi:hypothetical protein
MESLLVLRTWRTKKLSGKVLGGTDHRLSPSEHAARRGKDTEGSREEQRFLQSPSQSAESTWWPAEDMKEVAVISDDLKTGNGEGQKF